MEKLEKSGERYLMNNLYDERETALDRHLCGEEQMRREGNITLTDSQLNWQTIKQRCKHADRQIDNRSARQRAQQRSKLADLL